MFAVSPTLTLIIKRTLPLTVGLFAIMLVQLVDSVFIGMLGLNQLAVHSITLPFQAAFIGIQVGIGVAATSIISKACGYRDKLKSQTVATLAAAGGTLFITLLGVVLWLLQEPILATFIASDVSSAKQLALAAIFNRYWPVWLLSAISVAALYLVSCVYRANEDTKTTGQMFLLASIINLILDPLLIFGFNMGIVGAALASTLSYGICTLYMLNKARGKQWFAAINLSSPSSSTDQLAIQNSPYFYYGKELIRTTVPTILNQSLPSLSAFICMLLIAQIGTEEIAFWSLLSRLESFLLVFTLALTMAIPPIIGRYLGEGKLNEIVEVLTVTAKFLLVFHLAVALIAAISSPYIIPLISADKMMQNWFSIALWIIPFSYAPLGLCMLVVSAFNALGEARRALFVSMVRLLVLYVPAIWLGTSTDSIIQTIIAACIANTLAGAYAWFKLKQCTALYFTRSQLA
ncbi:MATE family efflux transporter [Agarivorans sp. B2Z047]|uniref:MATE family efflux transporter n=1 Tax=Agarivorans sp. B2Z047 TaxID=2652721 RepID=UPI00128BBCFA|nr:MATE family efflux transporter [Agarivorans sp. B2Z047]MPW27901.1 MATE family efflux transporter [Agarivorans sp. B2Z047]UQN44264.1 MATE family efflux transporter [Agarivorans sp. B2Z047]